MVKCWLHTWYISYYMICFLSRSNSQFDGPFFIYMKACANLCFSATSARGK